MMRTVITLWLVIAAVVVTRQWFFYTTCVERGDHYVADGHCLEHEVLQWIVADLKADPL